MSIINRNTFFKIFGDGSLSCETLFTGLDDIEPLMAFSRTFFPKTVIEIGVQRGSTAKSILDNSPWIEKYIGIDIPPGSLTVLSCQQGEVPEIAGDLVRADPRFELILRPNGTRDINPSELPTADLIFIDGDHSYDGVLYDTKLSRQVIKKGGIICWHDYNNPPVPDVTRLINELNSNEGDNICHIEGGMICFQLCRNGR